MRKQREDVIHNMIKDPSKRIEQMLGKKIEIQEDDKVINYTVHVILSGNPVYKNKNIYDGNKSQIYSMR